jgi:hypothetical protein
MDISGSDITEEDLFWRSMKILPARVAKISALKLTFYTTSAIIPWSIFFVMLGVQLVQRWEDIDQFAKPYIQPVIWAAILLMSLYLLFMMLRKKKKEHSPTTITVKKHLLFSLLYLIPKAMLFGSNC